jgi:hypothetical protein
LSKVFSPFRKSATLIVYQSSFSYSPVSNSGRQN